MTFFETQFISYRNRKSDIKASLIATFAAMLAMVDAFTSERVVRVAIGNNLQWKYGALKSSTSVIAVLDCRDWRLLLL